MFYVHSDELKVLSAPQDLYVKLCNKWTILSYLDSVHKDASRLGIFQVDDPQLGYRHL